MTINKVDTSGFAAAIANAKAGDTIAMVPEPGTLLLTKALPQLNAPNVTLMLDGLIARMKLKPTVYGTDIMHIAAMNQLGFSGTYPALAVDQKSAVDKLIAGKTVDPTAARSVVNAFLATLSPITERMWDAQPQRIEEITLNGLTYRIGIHWGSGLSKGILTVKEGVFGTYVEGATWENARMEGSNYNASGIRSQGGSLTRVRNKFRDCEDGVLASMPQGIPNPNGEWCAKYPTRLDMYGFNLDVDCEYDNCGGGGLAHGEYNGASLFNVSVGAHIIRANAGHGIKLDFGLQLVLGALIEDPNDSGGYVQCIDLNCGPSYVINSDIKKASMGTGNYNAPILIRNDRDPIADWLETSLLVMGNTITFDLPKPSSFVKALNEPKFANGWPGVPRPINKVVVQGNVFRCPAGALVAKTQVVAPPGAIIKDNVIIGMTDVVPDKRVPLPNYDWSPANLKSNVADVVSKVDPDATWTEKLLAMPLEPNGSVVVVLPPDDGGDPDPATDPETIPDPEPVPAPKPAPAPPPPTPEETIAMLQEKIDALTAASQALQEQVKSEVDAANARAAASDKARQAAEQERDAVKAELAAFKSTIAEDVAKLERDIQTE